MLDNGGSAKNIMKITQAACWTEQLALTRPYTIAYDRIDSVDNIFVRLEAEDGSIGVGVAAPDAEVTGESEPDCRLALETGLESLESLLDARDALECLQPPRPFGIFNIKLMKCGGIAAGLQIAEIANLAGIDLMWGCMDESRISIAAALHAALASPTTRYLDLDGSLDLARDLAQGGFVLENGQLRVTDQPGLGVDLIGDF